MVRCWYKFRDRNLSLSFANAAFAHEYFQQPGVYPDIISGHSERRRDYDEPMQAHTNFILSSDGDGHRLIEKSGTPSRKGPSLDIHCCIQTAASQHFIQRTGTCDPLEIILDTQRFNRDTERLSLRIIHQTSCLLWVLTSNLPFPPPRISCGRV